MHRFGMPCGTGKMQQAIPAHEENEKKGREDVTDLPLCLLSFASIHFRHPM
jgi:hypothetical protein